MILDETNNKVSNNVVGEVFINGDTLMNSYLNDLAQTNATLVNIDNKIWVKTGDLGYLDEDGFLFLKGRIKRMFKISGINVYPSEVEKISCQVEGVFDASLEYIEKSKSLELFIILDKNKTKDINEIKQSIFEKLNYKLLKYSIPKEIIIMDSFPKTKVGKIDHNALVEKRNG